MTDNIRPCECCGQDRPYPTKPGKWRCRTNPGAVWWNVTIKQEKEGLTVTINGDHDPIWWPNNARWEKIED